MALGTWQRTQEGKASLEAHDGMVSTAGKCASALYPSLHDPLGSSWLSEVLKRHTSRDSRHWLLCSPPPRPLSPSTGQGFLHTARYDLHMGQPAVLVHTGTEGKKP